MNKETINTTADQSSISLIEYIISDFIDAALYTAFFTSISILLTGKEDNLPALIAWVPIAIYIAIFHCYFNWTPGMRIFGYKFINSNNYDQKLNPLIMILHWFVTLFCKISLLLMVIGLITFKSKTGFYWDRWFKIKMAKIY